MDNQRASKDYTAEVALDGITFRAVTLGDPVPLGRQILDAAGHRPVGAFSLQAILKNGAFEDVRLDEEFDLRAKGVERFIAFTGDRLHRFFANDLQVSWGASTVSEEVLRFLTGANQGEAVYLEVRGGTDRLIRVGEEVDLTEPSIERFITAKRQVAYRFLVDGTPYETDQARLTGLQIKARVPNWDPNHDLSIEGLGDQPDRLLADDESLNLDVASPVRLSSVPKANFG